jgi:hypothetical protein
VGLIAAVSHAVSNSGQPSAQVSPSTVVGEGVSTDTGGNGGQVAPPPAASDGGSNAPTLGTAVPTPAQSSPTPRVSFAGTLLNLTATGAIKGSAPHAELDFHFCNALSSGEYLYEFAVTLAGEHVDITLQTFRGDTGPGDDFPDLEILDLTSGTAYVAVGPASTSHVAADGTSVTFSVDMVDRDTPGQTLHVAGSFECTPS